MDTKSDLTKGTLSNKLDEFVVLQCGRRKLVVFLDEGLYELYQPISLLKYGLVDFGGPGGTPIPSRSYSGIPTVGTAALQQRHTLAAVAARANMRYARLIDYDVRVTAR